tara:strand:- start:2997 stop:3779 length:783 start_codon:yes stop_codon:yes gene_type:complete
MAAVLSSSELRSLHAFIVADASSTAEARADVAEWLRVAISRAREMRRSLIIEGEFRTSSAALGVVQQFLDAGYEAEVIVVIPRRAETLLAVASSRLRAVQRGGGARETTVADHDARWADAREVLVASTSARPDMQLTILDGSGTPVLNDAATPADTFDRARAGGPTKRAAVEWLGELRRVTDFARTLPPRATELDLLIELHQLALREVVPRMNLSAGSTTGPQLESRLAAEAQSLRRQRAALPTSGPANVAGPELPAIDR